MSNVDVTPGTGKTVATDTVSGVEYQKVKIDGGAAGATNLLTAGQQTMTNSFPVVLASNHAVIGVGGDVASATTDSGNPVKVGGRASTANPTKVTDGQRVNAMFDAAGRLVTSAEAPRELVGVQQTSITASVAETVIVTAATGVLNDISTLIITNSSATGQRLTLKDSTAGTTRGIFYIPPTNGQLNLAFSPPMPQATATAWTITCSVSAASPIDITVVYVKRT